MPARKSIRALDNTQPNGRKKFHSITSGEPSHQQQPPETLFHRHNLRSRRLPLSDAQQILRKGHTIVRKDSKEKCEQAGTSREDQIIVRRISKEKYKQAGTSLKDQTIVQKHPKEKHKQVGMSLKDQTSVRKKPKEKCKQARMARKDRAIIRKRSKGKCEQAHTIEPDPTPPSISASPVPLTKEALRLLNRNTDVESSKSSNMISDVSESVTLQAQSGSMNAYDPEYRNTLEDRDVFFADDKDPPPNFHELWKAMSLSRESPGPDDIEAENLRAQLTNANNESASIKDILPQLVPLLSMQLENDTTCVKDQPWRREIALQPDLKPALTTPKPTVTIGWRPEVFKSRFKEAYKSLQAFISPITGFRSLAWPIFTIEARGDGGSMRVARL